MYPGPATRPVNALGLTFPSALGLAAGFDKNAVGIDALAALGFGHVEVGTVTGEPQPGNPKPRLFRLPADRAVVNRMGFNNDGAEAVAGPARAAGAKGRGTRPGGPGRQHRQDQGRARGRRGGGAGRLHQVGPAAGPYADYLVVNVSSPNTPGCAACRPSTGSGRSWRPSAADGAADVPLLVKIAPDLADDDVLDVAALALELRLDGIIATNTTISRDGLRTPAAEVEALGAGGLSGARSPTGRWRSCGCCARPWRAT